MEGVEGSVGVKEITESNKDEIVNELNAEYFWSWHSLWKVGDEQASPGEDTCTGP